MNSRSIATDVRVSRTEDRPENLANLKLPRSKFPLKKVVITAISSIVLLVAAIGGTMGWCYMTSHETTDDAYVDGNLTQVSSRLNGTVSQVLVNDNEYVKAGQKLALLDARDFDIKVLQARASLAKAQRQAQADAADISVATSEAGAQQITADSEALHATAAISMATSDVANARAAVGVEREKLVSLETQQKQYATDLKRYASLVSQGAISRQQYDQSKTQYDVSTAQIAAEKQALHQSESNVSKAAAELQQAYSDQKKTAASHIRAESAVHQTTVKTFQSDVAKATVDQANADLQNALLQRSYATITAPVAGRIGKKSLQVGEQVQSGQALFSLVPDSPWITANLKETQIGTIKPHQPVAITIDAFPGHSFKGYIESLSPASGAKFALMPAENATGNFTKIVQRVPIKIVFDEASIAAYKQVLVPGLSAQVNIAIAAN